jgi:hypothetical protein
MEIGSENGIEPAHRTLKLQKRGKSMTIQSRAESRCYEDES